MKYKKKAACAEEKCKSSSSIQNSTLFGKLKDLSDLYLKTLRLEAATDPAQKQPLEVFFEKSCS